MEQIFAIPNCGSEGEGIWSENNKYLMSIKQILKTYFFTL